MPAEILTLSLSKCLKKILAPHFEQKPLFAILEDLYHFKVLLLIKVILFSEQAVYAA